MNRMQELVAHADGIAMRLEYHTVERIGYDENRKTGASLKTTVEGKPSIGAD